MSTAISACVTARGEPLVVVRSIRHSSPGGGRDARGEGRRCRRVSGVCSQGRDVTDWFNDKHALSSARATNRVRSEPTPALVRSAPRRGSFAALPMKIAGDAIVVAGTVRGPARFRSTGRSVGSVTLNRDQAARVSIVSLITPVRRRTITRDSRAPHRQESSVVQTKREPTAASGTTCAGAVVPELPPTWAHATRASSRPIHDFLRATMRCER